MKIGFVSMPLAGHLNPMPALARRLQSRGREVVFIGFPDVEPFARSAGLDFVAYCEKEFPAGSIAEFYRPVSKLHGLEVTRWSIRETSGDAAETIFVRDGYEGAELGEIASLAGRTKGAIYAHFENKEDLFIALFAERMTIYADRMREMLASSTSTEQSLQIFRKFSVGTLEDKNWLLLLLEFKLLAIRRPESKERLRKVHRELLPQAQNEESYAKVFGSSGHGKAALSRVLAVATLAPILSALAVEAQFEPALLEDHALKKVAGRLFDALLPAPSR